ncbi:pantoate--beta-alanine ligase [Actinomyces vulturis]|uniref:pantoate--beta-alanine ligase n=1 Tax=Actinomyces vulturis TaxID=1857645 RepID=UPI000830C617|nr:pantoate--beta-alanine ligase [Actinomyces vulturis]
MSDQHTSTVTLARSIPELHATLDKAPGERSVVMTMGALHQGHADLVRAAADKAGTEGTVVVTIFVNPLQFAPNEDLDAYPRDLEGDVDLLTQTLTTESGELRVGALVVFAPTPEVIYPHGEPQITVNPGPMATVLEGATRPTHFGGVCQVVLSLMNLIQPTYSFFGRKDAQQLAIVSAMVRDLHVPTTICPVDIRRDDDGLALSSRNAYLSDEERTQALALSQSLTIAEEAARAGQTPSAIRQTALDYLTQAPGVDVDYVAIVDPDTFIELSDAALALPQPEGFQRPEYALVAVAARVGATRLIDNRLMKLA